MQQTDKYKLNLIERDDVFSPDALNENAEKLEEALGEVTAHADAGDAAEAAARTAADAALEQRVVALEAHHIVVGSYWGNNQNPREITLGFTPQAVIVLRDNNALVFMTGHNFIDTNVAVGAITPNGFSVNGTRSVSLNYNGEAYYFLALA